MLLSILPYDEVRTDALAGSGNGRGGRSWQVGKEEAATQPLERGRIVSIPVLGGLHHRYERRAA
jgi:hypothetical protein